MCVTCDIGEEWQRQVDVTYGPSAKPCYCCRKKKHLALKEQTFGCHVLNSNGTYMHMLKSLYTILRIMYGMCAGIML